MSTLCLRLSVKIDYGDIRQRACPVYAKDDDVCGKVKLSVDRQLEHVGIFVQLIGRIEVQSTISLKMARSSCFRWKFLQS